MLNEAWCGAEWSVHSHSFLQALSAFSWCFSPTCIHTQLEIIMYPFCLRISSWYWDLCTPLCIFLGCLRVLDFRTGRRIGPLRCAARWNLLFVLHLICEKQNGTAMALILVQLSLPFLYLGGWWKRSIHFILWQSCTEEFFYSPKSTLWFNWTSRFVSMHYVPLILVYCAALFCEGANHCMIYF